MAKLLLVYLTFIVGILFLFMPITDPQDYFLFSSMKLTVQQFVYFGAEKVVLIILGYIIASEAEEYRKVYWVFFYLLVADLADYLISYNTWWYDINGFPISMNIFKVVVFGGVILYEFIKLVKQKWHIFL